MNAFIIRPFGRKPVITLPHVLDLQPGKHSADVHFIDFDEVETHLIDPALAKLGIGGRTTIEIMRAGNIREDMFHRLLTADLVIADLSIHNANTFYELGLRHAFRDKYTLLIRSNSTEYPFDLQTDRYFTYQIDNPGESVPGLIAALKQTLNSDLDDSPVYKMIPALRAQDRSRFIAAPREFREAVERARRGTKAPDLRLLAVEAEGFIWEIEGLREVARAQTDLNFFLGAKTTWEILQRRFPDDLEANMMLSKIYERLNKQLPEQDLQTRSEQAMQRVFGQKEIERNNKSEVLALVGTLRKAEWRKRWMEFKTVKKRREQALRSKFLREARMNYLAAFYENLNNYHAGLNALALFKIEEQMAAAHPAVWNALHDDPVRESANLTKHSYRLTIAVEVSLEAERRLLDQDKKDKRDYWLEINEAIFYCVTSTKKSQLSNVAKEFEEAFCLAPPSATMAVKDLLEDYKELGVFTENVRVALDTLERIHKEPLPYGTQKDTERILLLVTGYSTDKGAANGSRSPLSKEHENRTKEAIKRAVASEQKRAERILFGMASGASGGELLFHEVCQELQIPTRLYLPMPVDQFVGDYVSISEDQDDWIERFNKIYSNTTYRSVLNNSDELPRWLQLKPHYSLRRQGNLWMLQHALFEGLQSGAQITLIALWNGKEDDRTFGIADLVRRVRETRIKYIHLDTEKILGS